MLYVSTSKCARFAYFAQHTNTLSILHRRMLFLSTYIDYLKTAPPYTFRKAASKTDDTSAARRHISYSRYVAAASAGAPKKTKSRRCYYTSPRRIAVPKYTLHSTLGRSTWALGGLPRTRPKNRAVRDARDKNSRKSYINTAVAAAAVPRGIKTRRKKTLESDVNICIYVCARERDR